MSTTASWSHADWPYLAANLYDTGDRRRPPTRSTSSIEYDGVTVGFIGAVTEDLPTLVSPDGIATLDVRRVVTRSTASPTT